MPTEYIPLTECFLNAVDKFANPRAQMYRVAKGAQAGGDWEAISAAEMLRRVAGLSQALFELGIRSGDRVGIFAPNCPEWHIADFAIQGLGAVVVPIYFRESPERLTYILKDSGARVAFTAGEEQARKLADCRRDLPDLENVISAVPDGSFTSASGVKTPGGGVVMSELKLRPPKQQESLALMSEPIRSAPFTQSVQGKQDELKLGPPKLQDLGALAALSQSVQGKQDEQKLRPPELQDSGARVAFTAGRELRLPKLRDSLALQGSSTLSEKLHYEELIARAGEAEIAEYRRRAAQVTPEQLATIIYTSGTTGEPKGVMLSHANLSSNARDFSADFELGAADLALSLLPLAHVYERTIDYGYIFRGASVAYVEQPETVAQALLEVRPTIMAAVPRFYEKTYANIIEKGHKETGVKKKIFDAAIRTAEEAVPWRVYGKGVSAGVRLRWGIADRIVYSKIRAGVGGRIRVFSSGGAPLAPELAEFFWSIGLPVYQGYGLTETSPVVTFNSPKSNRVGTVGRPISNVQLRIADDGEILVKGPCVMQGYYHKPEETRAVLTAAGWFSTGDIGRIDDGGFLIITDRKKELLKTAGGKFVAPAPIENLLKRSPLIANAMVVGDRRKFVSVLIVVNFAGVEEEARKAGRESPTPAQILSDPWVRDLIGHEVERLTASLAQYEKPKRFALLDQDFSYANGELTYTLKLKRRVIEERYADTIARLYADVEEPRPQKIG